ncbi:C-type lectin domain family 4 member E-like [Oncorhynchus mykiss]|uniref:C-type lectin domain-containing protein n=1 Tax=Oncorhynchus mykiss TaxID=8022 RepID=A0A8C7RK52_ONCMY|nr:C-type lectin domain family 4 member E-like [Oncorhynchus mykiss]
MTEENNMMISECIIDSTKCIKRVERDCGDSDEWTTVLFVSAETLKGHDSGTKTEDTTPKSRPGESNYGSEGSMGRCSRVAAACLGLLCLLLLAGIMVLFVYYNGVTVRLEERLLVYRTSNNNLTEQRDELQVQNKNLDKEKADLKRRYNMLNQTCLEAWRKFGFSLYYISDWTESWDESRQDCLKRGADLVIINSKVEQELICPFKRFFWIGLTDRETKGTWKWVDGTLMTTGFWSPGEPNGASINSTEDCAEVNTFNDPEKNWNDLRCSERRHWICEKLPDQ